MKVLTSPSKSQDFESSWDVIKTTTPVFQDEAAALTSELQNLTKAELQRLLHVSDKLAELNYKRFKNWKKKPAKSAVKPAMLAYVGDIYQQMQVPMYTKAQQLYAQETVRIITGLYGLLRPYDLIQPYRLEMNAKLKTQEAKDLYQFWQEKLTAELKKELEKDTFPVVVNIASKEYSKAIDFTALQTPYYEVVFKQRKGKKSQVIGLYAKKARGMMLEHLISCRTNSLDAVLSFHSDKYQLISQKNNTIIFEKVL